jgi:hypothetical protein
MEIKRINTEEPKEHWGFLDVDGRTIIDMGCGIWEPNVEPTPIYFLKEGVTKVIGIDPAEPSYNWYKENVKTERFFQHMDYLDSTEKFKFYINAYKPQVLKIDIEGGEIFMNNLTAEDLESVREIGIEYHNLASKIVIQNMATEWGFNIEGRYQLMDINPDAMGVFHLKKPKQVTIKLRKNGNTEKDN